MRGRKPTPTKLRILRGNPGGRAIPKAEPQPAPLDTIDPPDWLRDEAKDIWRDFAPQLQAQGILTVNDAPAFANFCVAFADLKIAEQKLQTEGDVIVTTTKSGTRQEQSPWCFIKARAQQQCDKWAQQFGIGASYRSRISTTQENEADEFTRWQRGNAR